MPALPCSLPVGSLSRSKRLGQPSSDNDTLPRQGRRMFSRLFVDGGWPPPDHLGIGRKSRQFLPAQASCRDPGTRPELRLHRRSSNANSLCGRNSAGSPEICATFQRDILRRHFLSSSPLTPARQSGLPKLTCEHRSKRRDTAATPLLADLLHLIAGGIVA